MEPKETLTVSLLSFIGQKMISIQNVIQNLQEKLALDLAVAQLKFIVTKITREFENINIWVKNLKSKNLIFNRFLIEIYRANGHLTTCRLRSWHWLVTSGSYYISLEFGVKLTIFENKIKWFLFFHKQHGTNVLHIYV